jgi:uncharacterized membrane protein
LKKGRTYPARLDGDESRYAPTTGVEASHRPGPGISGDDLGRIISLTDGVFAFALTLLALSLVVPVFPQGGLSAHQLSSTLAARLQADYPAFFGYVFAFVMIGVWWVIHNRTFQYIARYDNTLVWLNMAILLMIGITPFVMSVYNAYSSTQVAVDLFAAIQVALGLTTTGLWDYARHAKLLKPNVPAGVGKYFSYRGYLTSAVFLASIGVSFVSVTWAQLTWIMTFVVQRLLTRHYS